MKCHLFFVSLLLLLLSLPMAAQQNKFRVVDFQEDPLDLTAVEHEKRDANGDRYAVIKVSSENPDDELREYLFNFGYLNHITEYHNNKIWLYVQRNAKRVTIQREGYRTIDNFDLKTTIMPGKTYVMILSAEAQKVMKQMVQFVITPADAKATVLIKKEVQGASEEMFGTTDNSGMVSKLLDYGKYYYRVVAENYHLSDGMMLLDNENETYVEKITLRGNFGNVTLRTTQAADIYVDGQKRGTQQWTGNLKAGNYTIECRQANHKSSTQYITVNEGETKTFDLTPPTPITGKLSISSTPLDADIMIDGQSYGKTPKLIPNLLIGQHQIALSKSGFAEEKSQVEIKEEQIAELNLTLHQNEEIFTITNNGKTVSFKMIRVAAGTFQMGSNTRFSNEQPFHNVTLTNDYYIGETEVTQELWEAVMGSNPSSFKDAQNPVENVSWDDCKTFINKLNSLAGQRFRLPTEAEWEYAARGGNKSSNYTYPGSNNLKDVAWYKDNSNSKTHSVKTKAPNELGIYDMSGNVWEWCEDWYDESYYKNSPTTDPTGPASDSFRVYRGGGWLNFATDCHSAYRGFGMPSGTGDSLGLRLALSVSE